MPVTVKAGLGPRLQPGTASTSPAPNLRPPSPPRTAYIPGFLQPHASLPRSQQRSSIEEVVYIAGNVASHVMNINTVLRGILKQRDSAWAPLEELYNYTIILHALVQRTRDMFKFQPQVERVAKGVNQFPSASVSTAYGPGKTSDNWANRSAPGLEGVFRSLNGFLISLYQACKLTLDRRATQLLPNPLSMPPAWDSVYIEQKVAVLARYELQIENYLVSCKFVHMVCLQDLCTEGLASANEHEAGDRSSRSQRAMSAFYQDPDISRMAKSLRAMGRMDESFRRSSAQLRKGRKGRKGKRGEDVDGSEDNGEGSPARPTSCVQDLLVAIRRGGMTTVAAILNFGIDLNVMLEDGTYVLSCAVSDNKAALALLLALCGASPNVRHRSGDTPLHVASNANRIAPALVLLELGAEVDIRDTQGLTPLHVACREHHLSIVLQLLAHGANPNAFDYRGITPLGYAFLHPTRRRFRHDICAALLAYGARATGRGHAVSPVAEAVLRQDRTLLAWHLEQGNLASDMETVIATVGSANKGLVKIRPLYFAIVAIDSFYMRVLLRHGADVHYLTAMYGNVVSYLSYAASSEAALFVSRALVAGADPKVADRYGTTPLHIAAASLRCDVEVAHMLIRHGADCRATRSEHRVQPLHDAARAGRADICEQLIEHGADVNEALAAGITPAMLAVYGGSKSVLRFLITKGADIMHHTTDFGETAMHTACRGGHVVLAMFLLEQGVPIDATFRFPASPVANNTGSSGVEPSCCGFAPIHIAASRGHLKTVQWLIKNGADPVARIGRRASRECLSRSTDAYEYGHGLAELYCPSSATPRSAAVDGGDDEPDLGETPAQVARAFGHEAVAAYIEDHIAQLALDALET